MALAAGLLFSMRMNPLLLACNGPGGSGVAGLGIALVLMVVGLAWLGTLAAGFLLSLHAYKHRSLGLAIGGAAISAMHLIVATRVPGYLTIVVGCLALAVAAAGRSIVLTA